MRFKSAAAAACSLVLVLVVLGREKFYPRVRLSPAPAPRSIGPTGVPARPKKSAL